MVERGWPGSTNPYLKHNPPFVGLFWTSATMHGDPLCFIDRGTGRATATLLFPPDRVISMRSAAGDIEYGERTDFELDGETGIVTLTPGSRVPVVGRAELSMLDDPDDLFRRRQVHASYTHRAGQWSGYVPPFSGGDLPKTMSRLGAGQPVTIAITGDSISEGYSASGFDDVPPRQPPYAGLVASGLTRAYGSPIALRNFAVAGSAADGGGDAESVAAAKPDLVIVAFGMNDSGYAAAEDFAVSISSIVREIGRRAPDAEFVLVSSMLPNPAFAYPIIGRFAEYRAALAALCGAGIVLADVTAMWTDLLTRKSVYDLTGNGVNHPNDFGHQVYAQVILGVLTR